mmetsp:Transcript_18248/g.43906  ORF Transcript_18248/g.43906 Transcript_18248/m.43906 type:complete len:358 (-) Transcript_18248:102-1175(-)
MCPPTLFLGLAIHASFLLSFCHPFAANHLPRSHQNVAQLNPPPPSTSSLRSQILDFIEPSTGVPVKLIGSMHYNPASIELATRSINDLAAEGKLGSIVIESCDLRWNATLQNELMRDALLSEMKAAHDLGIEYGRPVVLGDQRINVTVAQMKSGAKEAVLDLVQPWNGGWGRLFTSISTARREAVPVGDDYLGPESIFDPKLLAAAPVSMIKYPISYMVKSPVFAVAITALILLGGVDSSDAFVADTASTTDILESIFLSGLETVIFARIFLKELLAERNEILATNILEQCRNYGADESSSGWLDTFFKTENGDKSSGAVYAPGSVVGKPEDDGKVVVAVLGLAHCNGIKKLLMEQI